MTLLGGRFCKIKERYPSQNKRKSLERKIKYMWHIDIANRNKIKGEELKYKKGHKKGSN
jgi:hypothetical protein